MELIKRLFVSLDSIALKPNRRWLMASAIFAIILLGNEETKEAVLQSLSDAYLQVSVFVALTLAIFYSLELLFHIDTAAFLEKHRKYQVPISGVMGVLPGCGGAVMIMTQYGMGRLGFGSVVAVLTSTMGDAAFLLVAQKPADAALILGISLAAGIGFGYLTEAIHGPEFMRCERKERIGDRKEYRRFDAAKIPWVALLAPGVILGLLIAFRADGLVTDGLAKMGIPDLVLLTGIIGAVLSLVLWALNPTAGTVCSNALECKSKDDIWEKVTAETVFITAWVIAAYLLFELGILWSGIDLGTVFSQAAPLVPLIAILLGFLPGCGPQVLVTSMYIAGLVPFSAQLGNAISNDGDALFPAIAISKKASIVATLYTAVPALLLGYGWYFLFEM